jgi:hypothetical protein
VGKMKRESVGERIWCKYCVYMYVNGEMRPIETFPGVGGRKDKEE